MELISVIVPVYNVEKYLERCMESLLAQSYEHLQIILIDDGSTDKSGEICDRYAKQDQRIEVIHKENGGLSSARNAGLDCVKGEYITFLDSDDVLYKDYICFLYEMLKKYKADLSICRYQRFVDIEEINNKKVELCDIEELNYKEALKMLLYTPDKMPQSSWGKMYQKNLFRNIRYPLGKINEDMAITYKLIYQAKKIVYTPAKFYFYFQRMDGIVRSKFSERTMDAIEFSTEILRFVKENVPELEKAAICYAFAQNVQVLLKLPYKEKKYQQFVEAVRNNIKQYRKTVLLDRNVSKARRLGALAAYGNLWGVQKLGVLYKRVINKEPV